MTHAPWEFRYCGQDVRIYNYCTILRPDRISLGDGVRIDDHVRLEGGEGLTIGENVHIGSASKLNIGGGTLIFGAHSSCSDNVVIATGHPDLSYLHISAAEPEALCHVIRYKTVIGSFVVIFAAAVILPGVHIGEGAIVGAGAVVTKSVEPWVIVAGNPARFIKYRESLGR